MVDRGELFLKKISLSRGKVAKLCHTFIKDGAVSISHAWLQHRQIIHPKLIITAHRRRRLCFYAAENPHALLVQGRAESSGKCGGRQEALHRLRHGVAARLIWVSLKKAFFTWRAVACLEINQFQGCDIICLSSYICFFCFVFVYSPSQHMAEKLRSLNIPVTVVLDAAVG